MNNPVAVIISDIHYSVPTLALADAALRQAINKANELHVPLIIAGDLHDTKANMRGECVNALLKTFSTSKTMMHLIIGNHDKINEKSLDHSLNFLKSNKVNLIEKPQYIYTTISSARAVKLFPYYSDPNELRAEISVLPKDTILIMHQGVSGSNSGEYIQDKSAITKEDVKGFRVISGHYHTRQTIDLPQGGSWDYIGNPYTLNFGEANDPEKGFRILMSDGSLEFVPTNLRKHVVLECNLEDSNNDGNFNILSLSSADHIKYDDLVRVKITGPSSHLNSPLCSKNSLSRILKIKQDFRLELIPLDSKGQVSEVKNLTQTELLDAIIDNMTNTSVETKVRLKQMWKTLCE